ncbi:MAG TPA: hypothetical protein VIC33_04580 [Vicinamibacterales bacterium]|jgi:hypothetical protein
MEIRAVSSSDQINDHTPKREKREGSLWRRLVAKLPGSPSDSPEPEGEPGKPARREGVGDNLDLYA